jgi:hypothetical protein
MTTTDSSMNVCSSSAYLNALNQRSRFQLFNIPPNRYDNLANNPYSKINPATNQPYTKYDLDMRRKAEILKYSSNRMSTQTNSLTKAQIYAQASNSNYSKKAYSLEYINENTINGVLTVCPVAPIIQTPTSACDVPGPVIYLYDDPSIPLYNLVNDTNRAYGIINQAKDPYPIGWQTSKNTDVTNNGSQVSTVFSIYFFTVTSPIFLFSGSFPITIGFSGTSFGIPSTTQSCSFTLSTNNMSANVLYSYSSVAINPIFSFQYNTTLTIDISQNTTSFRGSCYFDTVNFTNISLRGLLGYIYDFQYNLNMNIVQNTNYAQNYNQPIVTAYLNSTSPITPTKTKCNISGNPVITTFPIFNLTSSPRS